MRKIMVLLVGLILCWTMLQATPSKAKWGRKIFIGYDSDSYYCISIERIQPGSYYEYTDYVYFCKHNNNGTVIDKKLLRKIYHKQEAIANEPAGWNAEEKIKNPINLERYLIDNHIFYVFPDDCLNKFKISFSKKGMFLEYANKKELLLSERDLEKWVQEYKDSIAKLRVVEYYKSERYFYFLIQYGDKCYDTDFLQEIIPISSSEVEKAKELLEKEIELMEKGDQKKTIFPWQQEN
ncbi:MAG: hypothetical protein N2246_05660 [Candidatus Sumerlaeia bacterium]|nr:hypothetical protein [Candidatus Sumerlaeia bacterium]